MASLSSLLILVLLGVLLGAVVARKDTCGTGVNQREVLKHIQQTTIKTNATCDACELAVAATRDFIDHNNKTQDDIEEIVDFFCAALKIEDKYICKNIVIEFQGLLFYLIADKQLTSRFACGVIGLCPATVFPKWNVTLTPTPPYVPYPTPNPKNPSMFIAHVTDIHIDQLYTPGLSAECGEPICCRPPNPSANPGAGKWGDYACDLPPPLYENMLEWIGKNLNISYAVFTGDLPPHDVWAETRATAINALNYVSNTWRKILPDVPLYPCVGNHEAVPVNEFAPRSVTGQWNMSWLYGSLSRSYEYWLPTAALAKLDYAGYYTTQTADGVRIISMNTNLGCNSENMFLAFPSSESADPDQQLQWLADTLADAEQNKEKVYILKHIAPSIGDCGADWWRNYLNIVDRYKNIIYGDFAGHTHDDIFTVTYKLNGTAVRPIYTTYFAGSVTPYSDENPGFRVYEVDSVTKALIDYTEYAINLTQANLDGFPTWRAIYSARKDYKLADMSPQAWHDLSLRMGKNETMLYEYWGRMGKNSFQTTCDLTCLHGIWCDLWNPPPDTAQSICGL